MDSGLLEASLGKRECDLLLKNCRIVDVFSCETFDGDIGIYRGRIAGFEGLRGKREIDVAGATVAPGFFDSHVHIESSMVSPREYARAVVPKGTTSVVADPHEIANVLGLEGIRYMVDSAADIPMNVFFMMPSCVPSTVLETSGARLGAEELMLFIEREDVLGLGEVMNYHALLTGSKKLMEEVEAFRDKRVDGHAPKLSGRELSAYCALGVESDHECVSAEEAEEKLRKGMRIMVREGTAAKNMEALLPLIKRGSLDRFIFVTDDMSSCDLAEGHINHILSKAVSLGLKPEAAVRMATLNPCEYFRIESLGAIAPGYLADITVLKDMIDFEPELVIKDGNIVAKGRELLVPLRRFKQDVRATVNIKRITQKSFAIKAKGKRMNIISLVKDEIENEWIKEDAVIDGGLVVSDTERDVLKLCVVERHRATGNVGKGFVRGFSLKSGAIASSVAHDTHNIISVGTNDPDMYRAVRTIASYGGGQAVVEKGRILSSLKLPIAGLMSEKSIEEVAEFSESINEKVKGLGCKMDEPFMALSFLTVPVIPELRLTDKGLVDVSRQRIIPLFEKS